jgi:hypothetical protein
MVKRESGRRPATWANAALDRVAGETYPQERRRAPSRAGWVSRRSERRGRRSGRSGGRPTACTRSFVSTLSCKSALRRVSLVPARDRMCSLMYPPRTRRALSVLKTSSEPDISVGTDRSEPHRHHQIRGSTRRTRARPKSEAVQKEPLALLAATAPCPFCRLRRVRLGSLLALQADPVTVMWLLQTQSTVMWLLRAERRRDHRHTARRADGSALVVHAGSMRVACV